MRPDRSEESLTVRGRRRWKGAWALAQIRGDIGLRAQATLWERTFTAFRPPPAPRRNFVQHDGSVSISSMTHARWRSYAGPWEFPGPSFRETHPQFLWARRAGHGERRAHRRRLFAQGRRVVGRRLARRGEDAALHLARRSGVARRLTPHGPSTGSPTCVVMSSNPSLPEGWTGPI